MTSYVSASLRRLVERRANRLCEYCLIHVDDTYVGFQVDHVIAEKHGGMTEAENLGLACTLCNRAKGTDIGSVAPSTGEFTRFFNPRIDHWGDHFELDGIVIRPRTPIGEATVHLLGVNGDERLIERRALELTGRYPPPEAELLLLPTIE